MKTESATAARPVTALDNLDVAPCRPAQPIDICNAPAVDIASKHEPSNYIPLRYQSVIPLSEPPQTGITPVT